MARRMFSDEIISSDAFLDMPIESQLLYFHLGMTADDDGFVGNPRMVQRVIGAGDDSVKVLMAKKFILKFETGIIVIKHWRMNNQIRKDRYRQTKYLPERRKLLIRPNGAYTFNTNGATALPEGHFLVEDVKNGNSGNQVATIGQPSIGKDSIGKDSKPVAKATREKKVKEEKTYNFEEELIKLRNSNRKDHKIISLYWKKKGYVWENMDQFNEQLRRELRAAKVLKGYTGEQIGRSIKYCEENYKVWTLESVGKRIADVVNKKS